MKNKIGVILDWVPLAFRERPRAGRFDGTCVFEYMQTREGRAPPDWGYSVFDFGKNEVKNFSDCQRAVLAGAVSCGRPACGCSGFYPLSGLWRRQDEEWVPNKYGGNKTLRR